MTRAWRRRLVRAALAALIALLLMLMIGPLPVGVVEQEERGGHEVVQMEVSTERLLQAMTDLYAGSRERGVTVDQFRRDMASLLAGYRAPDTARVACRRDDLVARYTKGEGQ